MRRIILEGGATLTNADLHRSGALPKGAVEAAEAIVDAVRAGGDEAVRGYCLEFDGAAPRSFRVPDDVVAGALSQVDPRFLAALEKARAQIEDFHRREVRQSWFTTRPDGTLLGVKVSPLASAGIYVPGGRAQYPSTVLMNAVPARSRAWAGWSW